jgi:hypothetical protein
LEYAKQGLIHPHCTFRRYWDLATMYFVIYTAMFLPARLAFNLEPVPLILEIKDGIMNVTFILDLFLNFFTCYEVKGVMIKKHHMIAKNYLKTWFLIDFVSSFPFDVVMVSDPKSKASARSAKLARIMRITKMLRLLRAAKLGRIIRKYEIELDVHHGVFEIVKFFVFQLVMAHWLACFFFLFPQLMGFTEDSWPVVYWGLDVSHLPDDMDASDRSANVINILAHLTPPVLEIDQYFTAFYWSVTTMTTIGYGDICPRNDSEKVFGMLCMLIGAGTFAFGITTMCNILANLSMASTKFQHTMDELDEYLAYREANRRMKMRVKHYMRFKLDSSTAMFYSLQAMMKPLTMVGGARSTLGREVMSQAYTGESGGAGIIQHFAVFHNADGSAHGEGLGPELLRQAMFWVEGRVFAPSEAIIKVNTCVEGIFMLCEGKVWETFFQKLVVERNGDNADFFGYPQGMGSGHLSVTTVKAKTLTDCFLLPRHKLIELRSSPFFAELGTHLERAAVRMVSGSGSGKKFLKLVQIRNKAQDAFSIWREAAWPTAARRGGGLALIQGSREGEFATQLGVTRNGGLAGLAAEKASKAAAQSPGLEAHVLESRLAVLEKALTTANSDGEVPAPAYASGTAAKAEAAKAEAARAAEAAKAAKADGAVNAQAGADPEGSITNPNSGSVGEKLVLPPVRSSSHSSSGPDIAPAGSSSSPEVSAAAAAAAGPAGSAAAVSAAADAGEEGQGSEPSPKPSRMETGERSPRRGSTTLDDLSTGPNCLSKRGIVQLGDTAALTVSPKGRVSDMDPFKTVEADDVAAARPVMPLFSQDEPGEVG